MKYKKWTSTRFLVALAFAAAAFAASFVLGFLVTQSLGPGTSGVLTIIITTVLVVVGARIAETRGVFTLMVTLFTVLAIPTNMFGPPGVPKVLIGLATGMVYDVGWWVFARWQRTSRIAIPIAAALSTAVSIALIWRLMTWINHPRAGWMGTIIMYIAPVYAALGFLGGMFANWIFERNFASNPRVRVLRGDDDAGAA